FQDDRQLVTGEHDIPVQRVKAASGAIAIVQRKLVSTRKSVPGLDAESHPIARIGIGPGADEPPEIEERVPDRAQLPIDDSRQSRRVPFEQGIGDMKVAVDYAGPVI